MHQEEEKNEEKSDVMRQQKRKECDFKPVGYAFGRIT